MTTIYTIDTQGIYSGAIEITDPLAPLPMGVTIQPPELTGTQVSRWIVTGWEVLSEYPAPPKPSPEEIQKNVVDATQQRLDDFARTRNYDGILSLCTYATSAVPKFRAEGQYGVEARDATWAALYQILAEVEAGARPVPSGYADIEPDLPALTWPA